MVMMLCVLAGCTGAVSSFGPAVIPARPSAIEWPDAGAAVLNDSRTLEFRVSDADDRTRLVAVLVQRIRYKILSKRGLARADLRLQVDGYSSITHVAGRSVHPDGSQYHLRAADIQPVDPQGRPVAVGQVGSVLVKVPNPAVGGLVEIHTERVFTDPDMIPVFVFGSDVPILRSEIAIVSPASVRVDYRFGQGSRVEERHPIISKLPDGRDRLVFVEKSLGPYHPEPAMPHMAWVSPWLAVTVASAQVEERMYRLESWQHIGERLQFLFDSVGGLPPYSGSPRERYHALQADLKIVDRDGIGVLPPRNIFELRRGRALSGRDAAVLLLRSLRGAGVEAYPALLSAPSSPPLVQGFPAISAFSRVVVAVKAVDVRSERSACGAGALEGKSPECHAAEHGYVFVDPMCQTCRFGQLPADLTGGQALLVGMRHPKIIEVPSGRADDHLQVSHYELEANPVGAVEGQLKVEMVGHLASAARLSLLDSSPDADIAAAIESMFSSDTLGVKFKDGRAKNVRDREETLQLFASVKLNDVAVDYDRFSFSMADLLGSALPGKFRKVRRFPQVLNAPSRRDTTARVKLPPGYGARVPAPIELNWGGIRLYMACEIDASYLTCARRVELMNQVVLPKIWADFRGMVDKLQALDESVITIGRASFFAPDSSDDLGQ